jgi:hypothetical protein
LIAEQGSPSRPSRPTGRTPTASTASCARRTTTGRSTPGAARPARERYACFDHFSRDPQIYAYEVEICAAESCEPQGVEQLVELQRQRAELASRDGRVADDRRFDAEQNARLVVDAERYYRGAFRSGSESWTCATVIASIGNAASEGVNVRFPESPLEVVRAYLLRSAAQLPVGGSERRRALAARAPHRQAPVRVTTGSSPSTR